MLDSYHLGENKAREKLFHLEDEEYILTQKSKANLSQRLEDEFDYLIYKRQKEEDKKERIKQIDEEYEQMRRLKERKISEKISHSTQVRSKNQETLKNKMKSRDQRYHEIRTKIYNKTVDHLEKSLRQREKYSPNQNETKKSQQNTKNLTQKTSLISTRYREHVKERQLLKSEKSKKNLQMKLVRAVDNKKKKNQEIQEKQRQEIKEVEEINQKAKEASLRQQEKREKQLLKKVKSVDHSRQIASSKIKEQTESKKKASQSKVKKWEQNYDRIQEQNSNRLSTLAQKMDYLPRINKSWKNEKEAVYLQLFNRNSVELKNLKDQKAQKIMNKHQEISLKNKLYKEKKNEMLKYMKSIDHGQ